MVGVGTEAFVLLVCSGKVMLRDKVNSSLAQQPSSVLGLPVPLIDLLITDSKLVHTENVSYKAIRVVESCKLSTVPWEQPNRIRV